MEQKEVARAKYHIAWEMLLGRTTRKHEELPLGAQVLIQHQRCQNMVHFIHRGFLPKIFLKIFIFLLSDYMIACVNFLNSILSE